MHIKKFYAIARLMVLLLWAVLIVLAGCSDDNELSGVEIPNTSPDTWITGQPPNLLEAGFMVRFQWDGEDPDGRVVGFEWKISDNGLDGISVSDTLTVDPLKGEVVNPWNFTTAYDSTFVVLADLAGFPGDEIDPRSYHSYTIFIRAVDNQGARDPEPAMVSFTATTIVPTARLGDTYYDPFARDAKQAPATITVDFEGEDPDFPTGLPAQFRYLWKRATYSGATVFFPYILNRYVYLEYYEEVVDFAGDEWSDWTEFPADATDRRVVIPDQAMRDENDMLIGYLFAIQVKDMAGAVSVGRDYMRQVGNFTLKTFHPSVTLRETSSIWAQTFADRTDAVAAYQPLSFAWQADASFYLGEITAYRYGWDVANPADPYDENWAVLPGMSPEHLYAPAKFFTESVHNFTLQVTDNLNQTTTLRWYLEVIPYVDRDLQKPLLFIDGVDDTYSYAWPGSPAGPPYFDQEDFRNQFWQEALAPVHDFDWAEDRFDQYERIEYADLVGYQAVLLNTRAGQGAVMSQLRTDGDGQEHYTMLESYQRRGGNLFFCGGLSLFGFLQNRDDYMVPIIFDTDDENLFLDGEFYTVGFGDRTLPDGTVQELGVIQYPYKVAGIAVLDWTSPATANIYNRPLRAKYDRRSGCAGLKALVLDPDFRSEYAVAAGTTGIPDTLFTESTIDWKDEFYWDEDLLNYVQTYGLYTWGQDEFYDVNIASTRLTPYQLQFCPESPSGYCAEPMFRSVARFDWLRELRWAEGEVDWPDSRYSDLDDICGEMALTSYEGVPDRSALTNDRVVGFISYKMFAEKDWGKADIYWGFDPYRFDHGKSKQAIRWVLQYFGLQVDD